MTICSLAQFTSVIHPSVDPLIHHIFYVFTVSSLLFPTSTPQHLCLAHITWPPWVQRMLGGGVLNLLAYNRELQGKGKTGIAFCYFDLQHFSDSSTSPLQPPLPPSHPIDLIFQNVKFLKDPQRSLNTSHFSWLHLLHRPVSGIAVSPLWLYTPIMAFTLLYWMNFWTCLSPPACKFPRAGARPFMSWYL